MKIFNKVSAVALTVAFLVCLAGSIVTLAAGPASVNLGTAGNFAILSKTGVTDVPSSAITGNIGTSPITGAAIGVTCPEATGTIYVVDHAGPLPCRLTDATLLTTAVGDMETAYASAAGMTNPTATELGAGNIGGLTIAPGLYKWSTDVTIPTDVTLSGGANDVWVFQVSGNLTIASAAKVVLTGGAQASNVFWQVGGVTGATLRTYSTFNGNILTAKQIIIQTGAVLNGRALAQTQVTLDHNTISIPTTSAPAPVVASTPTPTPTTPPVSTQTQTLTPTITAQTSSLTPVSTLISAPSSVVVTPSKLPNTGFGPDDKSNALWNIVIPTGIFVVLCSFYLARKKLVI